MNDLFNKAALTNTVSFYCIPCLPPPFENIFNLFVTDKKCNHFPLQTSIHIHLNEPWGVKTILSTMPLRRVAVQPQQ